MTSHYTAEKEAARIKQAQEYLAEHPDATKMAVMQALRLGCVYLDKWVDEGHLKFKKRSPRQNWNNRNY